MAAAVDQIVSSDLGPGLGGLGAEVVDDVKARVLAEVKKAGWRWYAANQQRVLYSKRVFFVTLNLRVHELRFLFVEIFGPEPT